MLVVIGKIKGFRLDAKPADCNRKRTLLFYKKFHFWIENVVTSYSVWIPTSQLYLCLYNVANNRIVKTIIFHVLLKKKTGSLHEEPTGYKLQIGFNINKLKTWNTFYEFLSFEIAKLSHSVHIFRFFYKFWIEI